MYMFINFVNMFQILCKDFKTDVVIGLASCTFIIII